MNTLIVKALYGLTGAISIVIFILLTVSFSSPYWVECIAIRTEYSENDTTCQREGLVDPIAPSDRYTGLVEFGIIYGYKQFNFGYGPRDRETFIVFKEHADVYNTDLVIVTIVFVIVALVFSVPAASLGFINCKMIPIEIINGRIGLYAWNIIGFVSSVTSMGVYVGLYLTSIIEDTLNEVDKADDFCQYSTTLGSSFWCLVTAVILYFVNIIILVITQLMTDGLPDVPECLKRNHRSSGVADQEANINAIELKDAIAY